MLKLILPLAWCSLLGFLACQGPPADAPFVAPPAAPVPGVVLRPGMLDALHPGLATSVLQFVVARADHLDGASVDELVAVQNPRTRRVLAMWIPKLVQRGLLPPDTALAACRAVLEDQPVGQLQVTAANALGGLARAGVGLADEDRARLEALADSSDPWFAWQFVRALSLAGVDPTPRLVAALGDGAADRDLQLDGFAVAPTAFQWPSEALVPLWHGQIDTGGGAAQLARFALQKGPTELAALHARERAERRRVADASREPFDWRVAAEVALLERVAEARVVLFGEMHSAGGPLRAAQKQACEAFARGGGLLLLGYEPSVLSVQGEVAEFAEGLGFYAFALEGRAYDRVATRFSMLRDVEAVAQARALLDGDAEARLLVLRGGAHLERGGALIEGLADEDLVVIRGDPPALWGLSPSVWPHVDISGAVFQSARDPRFWAWCCDEVPPTDEQRAALAPFLVGPWRPRSAPASGGG